MGPRKTFARWVSIAAHPFILVPAAIGLTASRVLSLEQTAWVLGATVASMVVVASVVVANVRRGEWADVDVSTREHRPRMYLVASLSTAAALAVLAASGQPPHVLRGTAASLGLILVGWVINQRFLKVSMHTSFAVFAAAILATVDRTLGLAGVALALGLGWSRVELGRHTRAEVALGLVLGALAGATLLV